MLYNAIVEISFNLGCKFMSKDNKKSTTTAKKVFKGIGIALLVIILSLVILLVVPLITAQVSDGKEPDKATITNPYIVDGKALVSAHRSGSDIAPENTMMAFKECTSAEDFNVDVFEFDLHITKDGKLILLHDHTLDRTTNAPEFFGQEDVEPSTKTYEELRQLNFGEHFEDKDGNKPYVGLRGDDIPDDLRAVLLEDVLDFLIAHGDFKYVIEVKDGGENGFRAVDMLHETLVEKDLIDNVIFGTFKGDVTKYVDEHYPDMTRSASIKEVLQFYLAVGYGVEMKNENIKYDVLQIPANQFKVVQLGHPRFVNYAHRHNVAIQYWTINDHKDMVDLNNMGADCIITDEPDAAYKIVNKTDDSSQVVEQ